MGVRLLTWEMPAATMIPMTKQTKNTSTISPVFVLLSGQAVNISRRSCFFQAYWEIHYANPRDVLR
jgi:hypothetical protein